VTGGGRRIEQAIVLKLATEEAKVVVNYRESEEAARKTAVKIEKIWRTHRDYRIRCRLVDQSGALPELVRESRFLARRLVAGLPSRTSPNQGELTCQGAAEQ